MSVQPDTKDVVHMKVLVKSNYFSVFIRWKAEFVQADNWSIYFVDLIWLLIDVICMHVKQATVYQCSLKQVKSPIIVCRLVDVCPVIQIGQK